MLVPYNSNMIQNFTSYYNRPVKMPFYFIELKDNELFAKHFHVSITSQDIFHVITIRSDVLEWIGTYSTDSVQFTSSGIWFNEEKDALLFKMRWV